MSFANEMLANCTFASVSFAQAVFCLGISRAVYFFAACLASSRLLVRRRRGRARCGLNKLVGCRLGFWEFQHLAHFCTDFRLQSCCFIVSLLNPGQSQCAAQLPGELKGGEWFEFRITCAIHLIEEGLAVGSHRVERVCKCIDSPPFTFDARAGNSSDEINHIDSTFHVVVVDDWLGFGAFVL